jgi:hypothetical protein
MRSPGGRAAAGRPDRYRPAGTRVADRWIQTTRSAGIRPPEAIMRGVRHWSRRSFAHRHVAGTARLLLQQRPSLTAAQVAA